jgi:hypothetical protein
LAQQDIGGLGQREFSLAKIRRARFFGGFWQENQDEIVQQFFGSYESVGGYFRVMRQFGFVMMPINQRIDDVVSVERAILPGDPNDDTSIELADAARRVYDSIPNRETIRRRIHIGEFVGYSPIEKVFEKHDPTGLIAPTKLYDIPPQNVRFDQDGSPRVITDYNFTGIPVDPRKLMIFTWGSVLSRYGDAELKYVYPLVFIYQQLLDFGLESVEQSGRPFPVVYIPRSYSPDEIAETKKHVSEQFKTFMTMWTDESRARVEPFGASIAAGGQAGRAEQEWLRYIETQVQSVLLNTSQTADRGGSGNGKLEEVRAGVKGNKTAVASDAEDECWNTQWLADICEMNWSHIPRELWPRFKSDATEITQGLTGIAAERAELGLLRLAANQLPDTAVEELITAVGIPRGRARKMVSSVVEKRASLAPAPEMAGGVAPVAKKEAATEEEAA